MDIRNQPIEPDRNYHIYNHGVNVEVAFNSKRNFYFFLKKEEDCLFPVCETYSYCLLSNHFHFLVLVKPENELKSLVNLYKVHQLNKRVTKFRNYPFQGDLTWRRKNIKL